MRAQLQAHAHLPETAGLSVTSPRLGKQRMDANIFAVKLIRML